jgi:hypothetical protein
VARVLYVQSVVIMVAVARQRQDWDRGGFLFGCHLAFGWVQLKAGWERCGLVRSGFQTI